MRIKRLDVMPIVLKKLLKFIFYMLQEILPEHGILFGVARCIDHALILNAKLLPLPNIHHMVKDMPSARFANLKIIVLAISLSSGILTGIIRIL